MIRFFRKGSGQWSGPSDAPDAPDGKRQPLPSDIIWIDLFSPTREEEQQVETWLGLEMPTREEMAELEASSRLYRENSATYVTADLLHKGDAEIPAIGPATFILTHGPLVTIRYIDPRPFNMMAERLDREPTLCGGGGEVFLNLMEAVIDRTSDVLSHNVANVEDVANHVFRPGKTLGFEKLIARQGRAQIANARIEQSLAGLARVFAYIGPDPHLEGEERQDHLKSLSRDAASLIVHSQSVSSGINFQLSATLGLINIEQSSIIKIFSVAAVAFMPPTLIASIYGMNFKHMPELAVPWAYPAVLVAMVAAAILPLLWFRRKGWL